MKFRPLHDRVVVRRIESEEKTKGGIITQTPRRRNRKRAKSSRSALALETRAQAGSARVKAGDLILFGKWSGTEVKIDGEELLIMKESDIMGVSRRCCRKKAA